MPEETIYESIHARNRSAIASYLRRMADAFDGGEPVPVGESTTVDPPEDAELEVEVEREDEELSLEFEVEWAESEGGVEEAAATGSDGAAASETDVAESSDGETDVEVDAGAAEPDAGAPAGSATFELYRDRADEWRWRLRHANGNVLADGGEGYTRKANAKKGIRSVQANAAGADVEEVE